MAETKLVLTATETPTVTPAGEEVVVREEPISQAAFMRGEGKVKYFDRPVNSAEAHELRMRLALLGTLVVDVAPVETNTLPVVRTPSVPMVRPARAGRLRGAIQRHRSPRNTSRPKQDTPRRYQHKAWLPVGGFVGAAAAAVAMSIGGSGGSAVSTPLVVPQYSTVTTLPNPLSQGTHSAPTTHSTAHAAAVHPAAAAPASSGGAVHQAIPATPLRTPTIPKSTATQRTTTGSANKSAGSTTHKPTPTHHPVVHPAPQPVTQPSPAGNGVAPTNAGTPPASSTGGGSGGAASAPTTTTTVPPPTTTTPTPIAPSGSGTTGSGATDPGSGADGTCPAGSPNPSGNPNGGPNGTCTAFPVVSSS